MYVNIRLLSNRALHRVCSYISISSGYNGKIRDPEGDADYRWAVDFINGSNYTYSVKNSSKKRGIKVSNPLKGTGYFYQVPEGADITWGTAVKAIISAEYLGEYIDLPDELCEELGV